MQSWPCQNPYVSKINSAGNDDRILLTYLNISKPSAGSQLQCDEQNKDGKRLLTRPFDPRLAVRPITSDLLLSLPSYPTRGTMNLEDILNQLKSERSRLNRFLL